MTLLTHIVFMHNIFFVLMVLHSLVGLWAK